MALVSPANLSNIHNESKHYLSVFHLNSRSINNKDDQLDILFSTRKLNFDVMMFTETWSCGMQDVYNLPGCDNHFVNRTRSRGEMCPCLLETA